MPMDDDEKRQDMVDIYCIGEMVIDMIPGSEPGSYLRKAGGAPANVAITAAKNGLKPEWPVRWETMNSDVF